MTAIANSGARREGAIVFSVGGNYGCHSIFVEQDEDTPAPTGCTSFDFVDLAATEGATGNIGTAIASSLQSEGQLTFSTADSDSWITYLNAQTSGGRYIYIAKAENNPGAYREGNAVFKSNDCTFTATVKQNGVGGLSVTFNVTNNTSSQINGTVEIFCTSLPSFTVPDFTVPAGSSVSKTKSLSNSYINATIYLAEFQSAGGGSRQLSLNGSNVIGNGSTIYLLYS